MSYSFVLKSALLATGFLLVFGFPCRSDVVPGKLTCESLEKPEGIDRTPPHLSWRLIDSTDRLVDPNGDRGQRQTAYRILVATSKEKLANDRGDLWDSGRVDSDRSILVPYAGKSLRSHDVCWWKVRVWDKDGNPSAWSSPSRWTMGILDAADWKAKWLRHTPKSFPLLEKKGPEKLLNFEGCHWIWSPDEEPLEALPAGNRFFRKEIVIPEGRFVDWAYLLIAADDRYWLYVNGKRISISRDEPNAWTQGYEVSLDEHLRSERNLLAVQVANREVGPAGLAGKLVVKLDNGEVKVFPIGKDWKASLRGERNWQKTEFDDTNWPAPRILRTVGDDPWGVPKTGYATGWLQTAPSPIFRKAFSVDRPIQRATVSVAGLGYYELRLGGKKVGDHELPPAFSRYDRRVLYNTFDVTDRIRQGENVLGVRLGNGWYNMHTRATWDFDQSPWRAEPRMLLHLRLEMTDGSVRTIVSDESWKATTGPLYLDSIRAGEVYDARLEMPGWDQPGFDDSDWSAATVASAPDGKLSSELMPPMRVTETIRPISVQETRPGVFVYDLGQNIAGWARLSVEGPEGTEVTLRYSERLRYDGTLDRMEISKFLFAGPFQQDTYILKGQGRETWEPSFVYHGFRYVEVRGYPGEPTLDDLQGRVVHTDFERAGSFECSAPLLNRIQELTSWSFRGNFHGYPTDCPQREKNGWTGDAHLAAEQGLTFWNSATAYRKWMDDIQDEQRDTGEIAAIIPTSGWGYAWGNGPAWDSAYVLIPWYVYLYRGDRGILENHYETMKRYVDYVDRRSPEGIADFGLGDWAPADTETPREVTSTGYFHVDTIIVAQTAKILGRDDDAKYYRALANKIRKAFQEKFHHGEGLYANGSQTALSCALFQGLADPSQEKAIVDQLVQAVHQRDDHLDVGILGAKYLFHTLSDHSQHELAYRVATQTTPPSYGDWVRRDATTLWEHWDGHSSLNHIMYGDIAFWMMRCLAGIRVDPEHPGFKHVILRPQLTEGLDWVKACHISPYGPIRLHWNQKNELGQFHVMLPPNTTARLWLPARENDEIFEGNHPETIVPVAEAEGVRPAGQETGYRLYDLDSGDYRFEVRRQ